MSWDFFDERKVAAAKRYQCDECLCDIEPGEKYSYGAGKVEGDMVVNRLCLTCRALVDASCRLIGFDDGWPLGELRGELRDYHGIEDWRAWLAWAQVGGAV